MKNLTLKSKLLTCVILLCLFFIQSCRKDTLLPSKGANSLTISEAKSYFETNLKTTNSIKGKVMSTTGVGKSIGATFEDILANKQPIWEQAYQKMISSGGAVKIPLDFGDAEVIVNPITRASVPFNSLNYLLMYKDSLQKVHAEWVSLLPDTSWLYGKRDVYRGKIFVRDWEGKLIKQFSYPGKTTIVASSSNLSGSKGKIMSTSSEPPLPTSGGYSFCIRYKTGVCTCVTFPCDWETCNVCGRTACGSNVTIWVVEDKFPDDPENPTYGGGGGTHTGPGGTGTGSPGSNDYTPVPCNDGPEIINVDGSMSAPPCIPEPTEPGDNTPTSPYALALQSFINELQITDINEISFLANNLSVFTAINDYLNANGRTPENKEFVKWAVGYLRENVSASFNEIESSLTNEPIFLEIIQNNYLPRDKEPNNYYWRPKLVSTANLHEFLERIPSETKEEDLFNCHYHAFGKLAGSTSQQGSPNWILSMDVNPTWEKVAGNIQVGDRVAYYANVGGLLAWTHSGIVTEVDGEGYATKISSKIGPYYNVIEHHPRDISPIYGSNLPTFTIDISATSNTPASTITYPSRIYWRKK